MEFMAKRTDATISTAPVTHACLVSHPKEVADIIIQAAQKGVK